MAEMSELLRLQQTLARLYTDPAFRDDWRNGRVRTEARQVQAMLASARSKQLGLDFTATLISRKRERRIRREIPLTAGCSPPDLWSQAWQAFERAHPPSATRALNQDAEAMLQVLGSNLRDAVRATLLEDAATLDRAALRARRSAETGHSTVIPQSDAFILATGTTLCTLSCRPEDLYDFATGVRATMPNLAQTWAVVFCDRRERPPRARTAVVSTRIAALLNAAACKVLRPSAEGPGDLATCLKLVRIGVLEAQG
jgi:hypothetical protein